MKRSIFHTLKNLHKKVGIIGSGLAGLSCALQLKFLEEEDQSNNTSYEVIVFEKEKTLGGITKMAIAGINAIGTEFSEKEDSIEIFFKDCIEGGKNTGNKELVRLMIENSKDSIEFLKKCGVEFVALGSNLGGHSFKRCHGIDREKNKKIFGSAVISILHDACKEKSDLDIRVKTEVVDIKKVDNGIEVVTMKKNKKETILLDDLVIASGGYSANSELISKHLTNVMGYPIDEVVPTTNGKSSNSKILQIIEENLNAQLIDMGEVQLHPTGLVDEKNPGSHHLLVVSDGVRGMGAILVNQNGERFVEELGGRNDITKAIYENCTPVFPGVDRKIAYLIYSKSQRDQFGESLTKLYDHGTKVYANAKAFCDSEGVNYENFIKNCNFGIDEQLHMIYTSPATHHTMGGVKISNNGNIVDVDGNVFEHIYACGEVTGGLHGKNRLGGNSLTDCCVFGRICAMDIFNKYK